MAVIQLAHVREEAFDHVLVVEAAEEERRGWSSGAPAAAGPPVMGEMAAEMMPHMVDKRCLLNGARGGRTRRKLRGEAGLSGVKWECNHWARAMAAACTSAAPGNPA